MAVLFYQLIFISFIQYFYVQYHSVISYNCARDAITADVKLNQHNNQELSTEWKIKLCKGVGGVTNRWHPPAGKKTNSNYHLMTVILLLGGDIATNPGPIVKNPCCSCENAVNKNHWVIKCKQTDLWVHKNVQN